MPEDKPAAPLPKAPPQPAPPSRPNPVTVITKRDGQLPIRRDLPKK